MDRTLPLFIIGLLFGGGIGFAIAAGNGITFDGHDHGDPAQHSGVVMDHSTMDHGSADHAAMHDTPIEVAPSNAPTLDIMVMDDPMTGYNLHVMTDNFAFSPQNAGLAHVPGEGHAHVYINGVKLARIYSNWMHLEALPAGNVTVEVTLNSNDHRPLAIDGANIIASTTLIVPE
jgi:uncharacterized Zn-binding protein involved in type VI secretion